MQALSRRMLQLLILVVLIVGPTSVAAHPETSTPGQALNPLESLLKADGTLDLHAGFSGSLDPRGWKMVSEPGRPLRFVRSDEAGRATNGSGSLAPAAAPGDEQWDDRFNTLGVSGYVRAIAVSGNDVYVGGLFSAAGSVAAQNIARWNSATGAWAALGTGVSGTVRAIAVSGNDIYVGGLFAAAGGVSAQNIARWNGTSWSALGTGVGGAANNCVYAIAIGADGVYVGGLFNAAGGVPNTHNIARWNPATTPGRRWARA